MLASIFLASALSIPPLPPAEYDDTEVAANVPLPAVSADSRVFSFRLELNATPSNNVSIAFGRDADMDGLLSRSEEALAIAWDCGAWKVLDCVTGDEIVEQGVPGQCSMEWRLYAVPGGSPRSLSVSAGDVPLFVALWRNPPDFLFDAGWNTLKVVCRGQDSPVPRIDCSAENTPMTIHVR